jgi:hypothetical protein
MILLLPGLAQAAPPPSVPAWTHDIGGEQRAFRVIYETDSPTYTRISPDIYRPVVFTLTNNGWYGSISYSFPGEVINKTSGEIVYGMNFSLLGPRPRLNIGASASWAWNQKTSSGVQVPPGTYYGRVGFYTTDYFTLSDTLIFENPP